MKKVFAGALVLGAFLAPAAARAQGFTGLGVFPIDAGMGYGPGIGGYGHGGYGLGGYGAEGGMYLAGPGIGPTIYGPVGSGYGFQGQSFVWTATPQGMWGAWQTYPQNLRGYFYQPIGSPPVVWFR